MIYTTIKSIITRHIRHTNNRSSMRRTHVLQKLAACGILLLTTLSAHAGIKHIVVFGDSLSDNGNLHNWTERLHFFDKDVAIIPQSPPYYAGRFSNGPVWSEMFIEQLGFNDNHDNFAYGGACISDNCDAPILLEDEIGLYLSTSWLKFTFKQTDRLFIIWMGGNDYLGHEANPETLTNDVIDTLTTQIQRLIDHGANYFMLPNLVDFSKTPFVQNSTHEQQATALATIELHNQKLAQMIKNLRKQYPKVTFIDINALDIFNAVYDGIDDYGIRNKTEACYQNNAINQAIAPNRLKAHSESWGNATLTVANTKTPNLSLMIPYHNSFVARGNVACSDPNNWLFWDSIHPTHKAHDVIAVKMLEAFLTSFKL